MIRRSTLIAVEIVLGLMAAALIGVGVAWWRLSQGPVELNFIRQHVEAELSEARQGRPVGIERVELAWSRAGGALELRAVGVTIEDGAGATLSEFEDTRIELGLFALLAGRISVESADFSGGEVSITRRINGAVHVAFGPPGSPPDIIVPPPPLNETLEQRVGRVLDGLEDTFRSVGPGARLKSISVRGARLAIIDEKGGGRWTADSADFGLARAGDTLVLVAQARIEGAQGGAQNQAPANLRVTTDTAFQSAIIEFGARDARPRALLSPAVLGPFAGLDAPLTAVISVGLDRTVGINRMEGDITLGRGAADMAGGRFDLDGGRLHGSYDLATDELLIDQLSMAGDRTRINGQVRVRDASAIFQARPDQPAAFDIALPSLNLDVPGVFAEPIALADVHVVGAIVSAERSIRFSTLHARADQASLDATGRVYWGEAGGRTRTGVELDGAVTGSMTPQALIQMWPMGLGEGARSYLARSLVGGRVTDARVKLDIRPADLARESMRNEAVDVRFNIADGEMRFITTMSPLTNARGSAVLQGNRFDMDVPEARINNLAVTQGRIEMPRLKPRGAFSTMSARIEGEARNIVEVLLQEPLALGDRLPFDPASVTGRGAVTLRFQRPMLNEAPFELWRFNVDGHIGDFAANMSTRRVALSRGQLDVRGDQDAITISGPVRAGGSDVNIAWTERLDQPAGAASSSYQISGDFDANDLVRLGYSVASYAQGRVGVVVSGQGRGFDVESGNVQLDLRAAAVETPWRFWTKRAGQPASARFDMARQADGSLAFEHLDARGAGLVAQGRVRIARDSRILEVDLPRFAVEGRSDAHLNMARGQDGALEIQVRGALFDGAPFMNGQAQPRGVRGAEAGAGTGPDEPLVRANVAVDRLKLRGGATLSAARIEVGMQRGALALLIAEGRAPGNGVFSVGLGPRPGVPDGRIRLASDDGGFAMRALTGADNIVGGTATGEGVWRTGPPSSAQFTVRLRDFQVVRLPAMAGLLSSVGSLTGLVDTLNGDGIGFSSLDAPVTYANERLTIREARASGPALGLTFAGVYDIDDDNLDIDGVLVPSYGLNSMLGAVPILGDLLVSRRGEGVVGMTYSINGPIERPRVGVNPLSALTPGILRRIFEPLAPRPRAAPPAPAVVEEEAAPPAAVAPVPERSSALPPPTETASLPAATAPVP